MTADLTAARAVLVGAIAALLLVPHRGADFGWSLALHLAASGGWGYLVHAAVRGRYAPGFGEAFALAIGLRLMALGLEPQLSDDVYRYLSEGRLVLDGLNPYLIPPSEITAELRGPYWHLINNPDIPAAYPPAMQYALALGVAISEHPLGQKLVFGACDLGVFVALWRWLPRLGLPPARAIVYGLCPLVVVEFAGEGHGDSLAVLFTVLALSVRRSAWSGLCLGIATAGKLLPVMLLPATMRGTVKHAVLVGGACLATIALLWWWFVPLDDPWAVFDGTREYAVRWRSNDSAFALVYAATETVAPWFVGLGLGGFEVQKLAKVPLLVLGIGLLVWCWRRRCSPARTALWFFTFFVVAAPTVHPWYVAFLVPWLTIWPNPGLLAFCASVYLSYHVLPGWIESRVWDETPWLKVVEYAPLYAGVVLLVRERQYCSLSRYEPIARRSSSGTWS